MFNSMRYVATSMLAFTLLLSAAAHGQSKTPWDGLPDETVLAIQTPGVQQFIDALRKQTKLGAEVLTKKRFDALMELAKEEGDEEYEETVEELGRYGLKIEDFYALADGPAGFALVVERRDDLPPVLVGISWVNPGKDISARMVKAACKKMDDEWDEADEAQRKSMPRRQEIRLGGQDVLQFIQTETRRPVPDDFWQMPPDMWSKPYEEQERWRKEREEELKKIKVAQVNQTNVLVTRVGEGLIIVNTFPMWAEAAAKTYSQKGYDAKIDFDELSGLESARGVLTRLFRSMKAGKGGFVARMRAMRGMADAMPRGVALVEGYVDAGKLIQWGFDELAKEEDGQKVVGAMKALGFDAIGPTGFRMALDGSVLRQGAFMAMAAPRKGLFAQFDKAEALSPEPPAWAPNDVATYAHLRFDLAEAFKSIKTAVTAQDPNAAAMFMFMEQGLQQQLGVGVVDLLSSVGTRHMMLQYAPKAAAEKKDGMVNPFAQAAMALVWEPTRADVWAKVLDSMKAQMQPAPPSIKFTDQQGFSGVKVEDEEMPMGFFRGRGYLTLMLGEGTTDRVLSVLRKKSAGSDSLVAGDLYRRSRRLMRLQPGIAYAITNSENAFDAIYDMIEQQMEQEFGVAEYSDAEPTMPAQPRLLDGAGYEDGYDDPDMKEWRKAMEEKKSADREIYEKLKKILPTKEEMRGMMGVGVMQVYVDRGGFVMEAATELTPADE